ncbi:MAG TPA: hypothetical protein DCW31_00590 [Lactobacillus sp.]|nr:hypothetical protein [Lactobacillus sp.]
MSVDTQEILANVMQYRELVIQLKSLDPFETVFDLGSEYEMQTILILGGQPSLRQGDLRQALGIGAARMSQLINQLLHEHLVTVSEVDEDRRKSMLQLTSTGHMAVEQICNHIAADQNFHAKQKRIAHLSHAL